MNSIPAHGETDIDQLLKGMQPVLQPEVFVFTSFDHQHDLSSFDPIMMFKEREGTTLIITKAQAEAHEIAFEFPSRMITLNIHSALDAVGFLARISSRLAERGMGVNPVAGFFHDHLFIPEDRADDAMAALHALAK